MAKLSNDRLDKFRPQTRNANKHTQRGMGALEAAMRKYGYVAPMTAAADGEILDGSARIETSANVFGDDVIVVHHDGTKPVIMVRDDIASADTPEAREISIAANRIAQVNLDFDAEALLGDLQAGVNLDQFWRKDELDELLADLQPKTDEDETYSREIKSPVYKPSNVKPQVSELFDDTKAQQLTKAIQAAEGLTDEEREFLTAAARRHTVFHFNKIADFYAHASESTQTLMEDSALVIIDFGRAIELGYVEMTKNIAELVREEYGD